MSTPYTYVPAPQPSNEQIVYAHRPNHRFSAQPTPILKHVRHCDCDDCHPRRRRSRSRSRVRFGRNTIYRDETEEERRARHAREERHGCGPHCSDNGEDFVYDTRHGNQEQHYNEIRGRSREGTSHSRADYTNYDRSGQSGIHGSTRTQYTEYPFDSPPVSPSVLDSRDPSWMNPKPPVVPAPPRLSHSYSAGHGVPYPQQTTPTYGPHYATPQAYPATPTRKLPYNGIYAAPASPVPPGFVVGPPVPPIAAAQYAAGPTYVQLPAASSSIGKPFGYAAADYGGSEDGHY